VDDVDDDNLLVAGLAMHGCYYYYLMEMLLIYFCNLQMKNVAVITDDDD